MLITWKSKDGIKILTINELGSIINGLLIPNSESYIYPSIVSLSEDEILIACVGSNKNQLLVYK